MRLVRLLLDGGGFCIAVGGLVVFVMFALFWGCWLIAGGCLFRFSLVLMLVFAGCFGWLLLSGFGVIVLVVWRVLRYVCAC